MAAAAATLLPADVAPPRAEPVPVPIAAPVVGVQYDYVNAAIHGAAIGTIYHTSGEHVLSINSLDKDGTNHYDAIAAIPIGATITIGSQSAIMPVKATYIAGGMWSLTLDAWPDLPDGTYTVTVTP